MEPGQFRSRVNRDEKLHMKLIHEDMFVCVPVCVGRMGVLEDWERNTCKHNEIMI